MSGVKVSNDVRSKRIENNCYAFYNKTNITAPFWGALCHF